jgi:hypothetical protein
MTRVLLGPCLLSGSTTFRVNYIFKDGLSKLTHASRQAQENETSCTCNFIVMFFSILTTSLVEHMTTGYDAKKYTPSLLLDYKSQ